MPGEFEANSTPQLNWPHTPVMIIADQYLYVKRTLYFLEPGEFEANSTPQLNWPHTPVMIIADQYLYVKRTLYF